MIHKIKNYSGFLLIVVLIIVWEIYSRAISDSLYLPPFSDIFRTCVLQLTTATYLQDIGYSLMRCFTGYFLASLIMIPLGVLMGRNNLVYSLFEPLVEFFRPMPSAAIIPIAILFFGIGDKMKLFVVFFGASWPILINTIDGVRGVEPMYIQTGMVFGFSPQKILYKIIIPASLPGIFTGMRISVAIALILVITVEMIAGGNGIGYFILDAERSFHFAEMYAGVFTIGLMGYGINLLLSKLENKVLWWYKQSKIVNK